MMTVLYMFSLPTCLYFNFTKDEWMMTLNDPNSCTVFLLGAIFSVLCDIFEKLVKINDNLSKGKEDDERK